jgi:Carboxypeptidase regulatory-like domain
MKYPNRLFILIAATLLPFVVVHVSLAQTAQITGRVTDSTAAVIPEVSIDVVSLQTGSKRTTSTNGEGYYTVPLLPPGGYRMTVQKEGFRTVSRSGIQLNVDQVARIDFVLEVGEVSETLSVVAEAPLLRTEDAETGEVITNTMIQNLPQLNRDPLQLMVLSGNVQGSGERADSKDQDTRINGGRNQSIDYLVDGISTVTGRAHTIGALAPSMDGVAEFKVVTNPVSAEYGRVSGGLVELATKSGTNEFHGQVFDYIQNTILNANSWEQNRLGGERPVFNQNQFGAAIGGPILLPKVYNGRNKTFFFFNYDGLRYREAGVLNTADLPTAAMRAGDFTGINIGGVAPMMYEPTTLDPQVFDPATNSYYRTILLGGDGQHIPADRIHPVSAGMLQLLPLPNRTPSAACSWCENYVGVQSTTRNSDAFAVRIDQALNARQSLFGRCSHSDYDETATNWMGILSPSPSTGIKGQWGATLNYLFTISPTTIFDARVGGHYNPIRTGTSMSPDFDNSIFPFDPVFRSLLGGNTNTLPGVAVASGSAPTWGNDVYQQNNSTAVEAAASLSKVLTRHTLKFGYEHRRWYDNQYKSGGAPDGTSFFTLGNAITRDINTNEWTNQGQANAWGAFLLGYSGWSVLTGYTTRALNMNYHAGYVMDDFKVNSKLTLNLGLRWEMETPTTDRFDTLVVWDSTLPPPIQFQSGFTFNGLVDQNFPTSGPDATAQSIADNAAIKASPPEWAKSGLPNGALAFVNTSEHSSRKSGSYHPYQFAPRVGLAYSISSKTVLRASFAKMYLPTTGDPNAFGKTTDTWVLATGANGPWADSDPNYAPKRYWVSTWDHLWPRAEEIQEFQRTSSFANKQNTKQASVGAVDVRMHQPYELVWNVGLQHELPGGFLVEANYSANRGVGLLGRELISRVSRDLLQGGQGGDIFRRYSTQVAAPFVPGTTLYGPEDNMTLSVLTEKYPYFGTVATAGLNVGKSVYHSLNLRVDKRFTNGVSFLFNYTLSKLKDDVGGPGNNDQNAKFFSGGGKWVQSTDSARDVYGTSIWDEKHRLTATFNVELPFGRSRPWLRDLNTKGVGGALLEGIIGGWAVAGNTTWRSGRPIVWPQNTSQGFYGVEIMGPSWANPEDTRLRNEAIKSWNQVFTSPDTAPAFNTGILDITKLYCDNCQQPGGSYGWKPFGWGDVGTSYDKVRNPGSTMLDLSLLKRFPVFSKDGTRYLQFRMEAQNLLNMRGYADLNVDPRQPTFFGHITSARYEPRHIQMSLKFVF